jgi:hypothetical protein
MYIHKIVDLLGVNEETAKEIYKKIDLEKDYTEEQFKREVFFSYYLFTSEIEDTGNPNE